MTSRLLANTIDANGAWAIARRFQLALAWIGAGTLLGVLSLLGVAVIAARATAPIMRFTKSDDVKILGNGEPVGGGPAHQMSEG